MMNDNASKYNFKDFTLEEYEILLKQLLETHNFSFFNDFETKLNPVIWRHDVDFSLINSLKLAKIESKLNIKSTFFLWLHSDYYNLLDKFSTEIVKEIISLGHQVGIHFDSEYYSIRDEEEIEKCLILEKNSFRDYFNVDVKVFSFHNNTEFTLSCLNDTYAGLINVYSESIKSKFKYCSDSNGIWKYERLKNFIALNSKTPIQVLTHPVWWTEDVKSPKDKIKMLLESNQKSTFNYYVNAVHHFGREIID